MTLRRPLAAALALVDLLALLAAGPARADFNIPDIPLVSRKPTIPMVMLVASKDHRLFFEAYNDASDLDGDGIPEIRFKPAITYLGLFDSALCYAHDGKSDNTGLFTPVGRKQNDGTCPGKWSGNWLNYVTTSRVDALRVVLYGGMRDVDEAGHTVLRRAYIPPDAHAWAKEYTSAAVDGYPIEKYTPLQAPEAGKRHFFGNLTSIAGVNCLRLDDCSGSPPWLSVITDSNKRVWDWASSERPVLRNNTHGGARRTNYTVRVRTCTKEFHDNDTCRAYPSGLKPTGLLHEYGESGLMHFGLLTGSYDRSMAGGRLRKVMGAFTDEVDPKTGVFTATAPLVRALDALRIRDYNNGSTANQYRTWSNQYPPSTDAFADWGNPVGEMMYEALRYLSGAREATQAFAEGTSVDAGMGLPLPAWDDPYVSASHARTASCSRASLLVISDTNISYDTDQVPGAAATFGADTISQPLAGFNAERELDAITEAERDIKGRRFFVGQSGTDFDAAPTPKEVRSLASVRGLAPEEPTKRGGYTAAAVARFGKVNDLRPDLQGRQSVDTFVVALASPLARINVPIAGKAVTLVPFAKTISGSGVSAAKGSYQPTAQIVDFYVDRLANTGPGDTDPSVNGGRYFAKFLINFEDAEQGADHDMDVVVEYTVQVNADGTLTVELRRERDATAWDMRVGYVVSGTDADGVYLEVQNQQSQLGYFLNTPRGKPPGHCDRSPMPGDCASLPYLSTDKATRIFRPGDKPAATFLKDPLWYAAKWGGFVESKPQVEPHQPDLTSEWDADGKDHKPDGAPDTYLMVNDATRLRQALRNALEEIQSRASSASGVTTNGPSLRNDSLLYQATFDPPRWSGDLQARRVSRDGVSGTTAWSAQSQLGNWKARRLFMRHVAGGEPATLRLDDTAYGNLSEGDRALFGSADVLNYLRGDRSGEGIASPALRRRDGPLGDFVHSAPTYDRHTDTLYIGGNDGMLHAFRAKDGVELFGVIPRAVVSRLPTLARQDYQHQYFVDGAVAVAERHRTATSDKGYLYALLGRGGKGLFSLDVTAPATFSTGHFLWEYTPQASTAAAADPDLGLMLGEPVPVRLHGDRLGVLVGNGYNSKNGDAVLYIFIVNADGRLAEVRKLTTERSTEGAVPRNNGLATPAAIDSDNDGRVDLVIAGDLKGQVWRFDIAHTDPAQWRVDLQGAPLFKAVNRDNQPQPITAALSFARNDRTADKNFGKLYAFFGTGAYFRAEDPKDTQVQSWYGLMIDQGTPIDASRQTLSKRTISKVGSFGGRTVRTFSLAQTGDMTGKSGWYIDFDQAPAGERIVTRSRPENMGIPVLVGSSLVPSPEAAGESCEPGGIGYVNVVELFTGGGTTAGVLDINNKQGFSDDLLDGQWIGSVLLDIGVPTGPVAQNAGSTTLISVGGSGRADSQGIQQMTTTVTGRGAGNLRRRISWREIIGN